jgi:hypothetical protein
LFVVVSNRKVTWNTKYSMLYIDNPVSLHMMSLIVHNTLLSFHYDRVKYVLSSMRLKTNCASMQNVGL